MRQLRIVPASGAATTSEALDVRPLHAHAQVPAQVAVASDELDFVMLDDELLLELLLGCLSCSLPCAPISCSRCSTDQTRHQPSHSHVLMQATPSTSFPAATDAIPGMQACVTVLSLYTPSASGWKRLSLHAQQCQMSFFVHTCLKECVHGRIFPLSLTWHAWIDAR